MLILITGLNVLVFLGIYYLFISQSVENYQAVKEEAQEQSDFIERESDFSLPNSNTIEETLQQLPVLPYQDEVLSILEQEADLLEIQLSTINNTNNEEKKENIPEDVKVFHYLVSGMSTSRENLIDFIKQIEMHQRILSIEQVEFSRMSDDLWDFQLELTGYYTPNGEKLKTYIEN